MPSHRLVAFAARAAAVLAVLALAPAARAQTDYFWNGGVGASGNWDTSTQDWSTTSGGSLNYTWMNSGSERANFGTVTAGTFAVTIAGGGVSAYGLNFTSTGYTLADIAAPGAIPNLALSSDPDRLHKYQEVGILDLQAYMNPTLAPEIPVILRTEIDLRPIATRKRDRRNRFAESMHVRKRREQVRVHVLLHIAAERHRVHIGMAEVDSRPDPRLGDLVRHAREPHEHAVLAREAA